MLKNAAEPATEGGKKTSGERAKEFHVLIASSGRGDLREQIEELEEGYHRKLRLLGGRPESVVFRKIFSSDILNQAEVFAEYAWLNPSKHNDAFAAMFVEQPPLSGGKIALWAYHFEAETARKQCVPGGVAVCHNGYELHWTGNLHASGKGDTYQQTFRIFQDYTRLLAGRSLSLDHNCIRTWIYVHDIDHRYPGMVRSRREWFEKTGMTPATHYICSTGIEGRMGDNDALVFMDAYALGGVREEQVRFLKAGENLSPTHAYGVTFERGTAVYFGDRKHVFIAGTASIDHKGELLYPGNVLRQLDRVMENIGALLDEAQSNIGDIVQMLVYLRDASDYNAVNEYLERHYPGSPFLILLAAVCRPGWLVEIECIAIGKNHDPTLNNL